VTLLPLLDAWRGGGVLSQAARRGPTVTADTRDDARVDGRMSEEWHHRGA